MKFEMKKSEPVFTPLTITITLQTKEEFAEFLLRMNVNFGAVREDAVNSYNFENTYTYLWDSKNGWGYNLQELWQALDEYRDEHRLFSRKVLNSL